MKLFILAIDLTVGFVALGCNHDGAISPKQRVVTSPDVQDFGLEGTWRAEQSSGVVDIEQKILKIKKMDDGIYAVESNHPERVDVFLRATQLDNGVEFAVVDVEAQLQGKLWARYLAVTQRNGDQLIVKWIEGKNLASVLRAGGYSAVIERRAFSTDVYADADQLLAAVRKSHQELVGEATVFELVTD